MKLSNLLKFILIISTVTWITGCIDINEKPSYDYILNNGGAYRENIITKENDDDEDLSSDSDTNLNDKESYSKDKLKIISIFQMTIESKEFYKSFESIKKKAEDLGGYIVSHNLKYNEEIKGKREANIEIKVAKEKANEFIDFINNNLFITSEHSETINITDRFYDAESILNNLKSQENQLRKLYNNANNIEEIITINNELIKVNMEKESLMKEFKNMEDKNDYSIINIYLKEVSELTTIKSVSDTTSSKDFNSFRDFLISINIALLGVLIIVLKYKKDI